MSTQLKLRRGTTAQHSTFTGASGEITVDTSKNTVVVHDGSTAGGYPLAKEAALGSYLTTATASSTYAPLASPTFSGSVSISSGTANGVAYLNGSKVVTTGSALTFDGTWLGVTGGFRSFNAAAGGPVDSIYTGTTAGAVLGQFRAYGTGAGVTAESVFRTVLDGGSITSANFQWLLNNAEQMRLTSTGLGIGTSSPAYKLDVARSGNGVSARIGNGTTSTFFYNDGTQTYITGEAAVLNGMYINSGSNYIGWISGASGADRMRLDSSGNLGIGTSSPAVKLDVRRSGVGDVAYFFNGSDLTTAVVLGAGSDAGYIDTGSIAKLAFRLSGTEVMRLQSSNLGIGTSSPSYKLDVLSSNYVVGRFLRNGTTTASGGVQVGNNSQVFTIYGDSIGLSVENTTSSTTPLVLNTSGNLGLGVTPSAWGSNDKAIDLGGSNQSAISGYLATSYATGAYFNGTNWIYKQTGVTPTVYTQTYAGQHQWRISSSGTAGNTISFTQAMTLDASGNLGVGATTASAKGYIYQGAAGLDSLWAENGASNNVVRFKAASGYDNYLDFYSGTGSGSLIFRGGGTERARIDSSGNFLVGTTTASLSYSGRGNITISGSASSILALSAGGSDGGWFYADSTQTAISSGSGRYLNFQINAVEKARIDSSGVLFVGNSTYAGNVTCAAIQQDNVIICHSTAIGASGFYTTFKYNGSVVGQIEGNGSSGVLYSTASDHRLKDITGPLTGEEAKSFIMALQPKKGSWKSDGSKFVGFVAHEFQEVSPTSVGGTKDAVDAEGNPVYQTMQASSSEVMANLIALVQEQQAIIEQLKADVAALKGN